MNQVVKHLFTFAFALLFVTGVAFAQDNTATINQVADGNFAKIIQTSDQIGQNSAIINQLGAGSNGDAITIQTGDENTAEASANGRVTIRQTQIGNLNNAFLGNGLTQRSQLMQYQEGNENMASVTISGPGTRFANIYQEQVGDMNSSTIDGLRGNSSYAFEAYTVQTGDENSIVGTWDGGQKNSLYATQTGNLNMVTVDFLSNNNRTEVMQAGGMNEAIVEQN
jgi:hypothetical protein